MCERPATSREHVPPKCIFPELKDLQGENLRAQLITVPSCDLHNTKKSKDDEFLMVSLAGIIGNNSIGYRHNLTKVNRAIRNSSGRLLSAVLRARKQYFLKVEENAFIGVIRGTPDFKRLHTCFERIARGLFYHNFETKFQGRLRVVLGFVDHSDKNAATFATFIKHRIEIELRGKPRLGSNPRVFYYQFTDADPYGLFCAKMCFYEGPEILVGYRPQKSKVPFLLPMKLIEGGIKSYVNLEGKVYEFN